MVRCALPSVPLTMLINLMVVNKRRRVAMGDKDVGEAESASSVGREGGRRRKSKVGQTDWPMRCAACGDGEKKGSQLK